MLPLKLATALVVSVMAIAACGGPAAVPNASPGGTPGSVVTQAPIATTGPVTATEPAATSEPVGNTVDPCSLLSPDDLNAALGKDNYVAGVPDGFGQCSWNVEGASGNEGDVVFGAIQEQQLSFIKSAFSQGGVDETVAGHAAFYNPTEGLNSIWVDLGNGQLLVISFPQSNDLDPSYEAIAVQLAETALGNT